MKILYIKSGGSEIGSPMRATWDQTEKSLRIGGDRGPVGCKSRGY
jgi:hypothetical protein